MKAFTYKATRRVARPVKELPLPAAPRSSLDSPVAPSTSPLGPALVVALVFVLTAWRLAAAPADFITARGDQLWNGPEPFRFISFNIPNLLLIEDNLAFEATNAWRLPDRFEINDALEAVHQAGGTVARTYVISVQRTNDSPVVPRHVLGPGRFNEEAFRALDLALQVAAERDVRLIVPLVDNWSWWGGVADYAAFRGQRRDAFWSDEQLIKDFKSTVRFVITRTNTLTGVPYREDKSLLGWEIGNELRAPSGWMLELAAYVKELDPNHLVIDGFQFDRLREETLAAPQVDVVTTHHYPGGNQSFAQAVRENAARAAGRKPYFVGEFGFVAMPEKAALLDAVIETQTAGALLWSLRFRNRDGGFYWHSEPSGGSKYKAYHWPGFPTGADYDEVAMLALMREKAFQIRGLPASALMPPRAPRLLRPAQPGLPVLSWQGSVGATSYVVERAPSREGPWTGIEHHVDETAVQMRPLFVDAAAAGATWFYRVRASNAGGTSPASNIVGPMTARTDLLVDELEDTSQLAAHASTVEIQTHDCRQAKEDAHRLAGTTGSFITYDTTGPIRFVRVFAFLTGDPQADLTFTFARGAAGAEPMHAGETSVNRTSFDSGGGDYGYWPAVRYDVVPPGADARSVRIGFRGDLQIGRVEISQDR